MKKSLRRITALALKEWLQIWRDSRSLILALITPLLLILIFGYALNLDVKNVGMAVYNRDMSSFSRKFIDEFSHTEYIKIRRHVYDYDSIDRLINNGEVVLALVIPPCFSRNVKAGKPAEVQILIDASDSMSAMISSGYVQSICTKFSLRYRMMGLNRAGISMIDTPLRVRTRIWYNKTQESKNFIIPGLIVIILAIISALITSLTISREWERGTMETLITTPVRPAEVVTGKLLPYLLIGAFNICMTFLIGYFVFDIYMRGSFLALMVLALLFLIGTSSFGIWISSATRVQVVSIQIAIVMTYLPSIILSGFVFPISNMPFPVQMITYFVPAKYMIAIIEGITLKGISVSLLYLQIIFMFVYAALMLGLSIKRLKLTIN